MVVKVEDPSHSEVCSSHRFVAPSSCDARIAVDESKRIRVAVDLLSQPSGNLLPQCSPLSDQLPLTRPPR